MIRLLTRDSNGRLILREFDSPLVPTYAILSHTWNTDNSQEVTFDDVTADTGKDKDGYGKVLFCEEKTALAGLRYFWIDTCCINKRSETEFSEAINSMFRWYQKAARCFVYMSDVSITRYELSMSYIWQPAFRKSRWFTRGWTLQELIAPREVEFFTQDGERVGDKVSLEAIIHEITSIDKEALRGYPLHEFSVEKQKSWAKHRTTKKPEDQIYCLLGIFGIHMSFIYGEEKEHASRRLDNEIRMLLNNQDELAVPLTESLRLMDSLDDDRVALDKSVGGMSSRMSGKQSSQIPKSKSFATTYTRSDQKP